ncbi:AraC family transcriptional regulator [Flagellimonas sp. S3867]|uniref:helix-turn-helix domain-containing protein n=1 Tax=Flagellimonas sp. S3867 TaxID=2768063 RepID=UPI00168292A0|nr:AraC family transcriptional regulator [Flagellimonas sp. S3867]
MITHEFETDLRLKDYIQSYWYYRIGTNSVKHFDIFPDGHFCLVINLKKGRIVDKRLTGIWTNTASISYFEDEEVLGICFHPFAIGSIFKFNINSLLDDSKYITSLSEFNLNEKLLINNLKNPKSLVNYLNQQFLKFTENIEPDKRLKKCFKLIDESDGTFTVDKISKTVGLSSRQLNRLVTEMIGMGIKEYSKIIRLKRSLVQIKQGHSFYQHYYDQPHFIRELKKYTGTKPSDLDLNNNDRFIQYYYFA